MPTYQYACTECRHTFEQFQSFADDALTHCPECNGRLRKVFNAVGVVFKGSGFYRTDSRAGSTASVPATSDASSKTSSGSSEGSSSDSSPGGSSGVSSSDSGSGGRSDRTAKPAAATPAASGSGD